MAIELANTTTHQVSFLKYAKINRAKQKFAKEFDLLLSKNCSDSTLKPIKRFKYEIQYEKNIHGLLILAGRYLYLDAKLTEAIANAVVSCVKLKLSNGKYEAIRYRHPATLTYFAVLIIKELNGTLLDTEDNLQQHYYRKAKQKYAGSSALLEKVEQARTLEQKQKRAKIPGFHAEVITNFSHDETPTNLEA